jgi:hypothetical protein
LHGLVGIGQAELLLACDGSYELKDGYNDASFEAAISKCRAGNVAVQQGYSS